METKNKGQAGENAKTWKEKLIDSIAGNVDLLKNLVALLANPLVVSGLMVGFVCWIFRSKENSEGLSGQNRELRAELDKARRKCKKLRKKCKKTRRNAAQTSVQKPSASERNTGGKYGCAFLN